MRVLTLNLGQRTRNVRNELYKLVTEIAESQTLSNFYRTADPKWCLRPMEDAQGKRQISSAVNQLVNEGRLRHYPGLSEPLSMGGGS